MFVDDVQKLKDALAKVTYDTWEIHCKELFAACTPDRIARVLEQLEAYEKALERLYFAMKNEMTARGLPLEWQVGSAMGVADAVLAKYRSEK